MAEKAEAGNVSLSSLSQDEQDAINELIDSQYVPETSDTDENLPVSDADESADNADDGTGEDGNKPAPWRERDGGQYPYLVRGAYLRCQYGSHMRRLNLPRSHGYYIEDHPLMNTVDNIPGEGFGNISPFGVCQAPAGPKGVGTVLLKAEKNNPITGEPYKDANGNILAIEDNVKGPPCTAIIVGEWQNPHQETLIGAASEAPREAITTGSFLVCAYCGIIEPMTSGQPTLDPSKADPEMATLPSEMQEEVDAIVNDPSLSAEEKADKIIAVYERYLLGLAPEEFAEYNTGREALTEGDPNYIEDLEALEIRLNETLSGLNLDIRMVLNNMGDDILRATGRASPDFIPPELSKGLLSTPIIPDLLVIQSLVAPGKPLDLKNRQLGASTDTDYTWSIWARQWNNSEVNSPDSPVMRSDYAGNYLFGYFGAGYLEGKVFSADTLLYGAGAAQGISDKNLGKWWESIQDGNYGDNPGDSNMIQDGINVYNMTH